MNDAIDDSDDEVDYTKMDLGNKKGPIGRWDFDTQEEYSGTTSCCFERTVFKIISSFQIT